jgi:TRAP-type transport system small permease protein
VPEFPHVLKEFPIQTAGIRIARGVERVLALGVIVAIVIDFINVIGRYTGSFTLLGADEIEIDILIWITFLNAIVVSARGLHLRMDIIVGASPLPLRRTIAAAEAAVTFIVTTFVGVQSFEYVKKLYDLAVLSGILRVPLWIPHIAVFISFAAMAVLALIRLAQICLSCERAGERQ